jgi:dTDP-4-amino-4,6-dideoxygalactose transaminase
MQIPFQKPTRTGQELRRISDALRRGDLSGDGYYTQRCQTLLEKFLGRGRVFLTASGTAALEMAAILANLQPGDEVLVPTFTFPSTANALMLRGAIPRLVDIRPDTLNIDERQLEGRATSKTRAVSAVHYAGIPAAMDQLLAIANRRRWIVMEDATHALGARFGKRPAGTLGAFNAFSFHDSKNIGCGEGGALVVRDSAAAKRAEIIREKGTNRQAYLRGEISKYSWIDIGSSYAPSELQAAVLSTQIEQLSDINRRRQTIFERYQHALHDFERRGIVRLPFIPLGVESAYHLFHILCNDEKTRDQALKQLKKQGISAAFHYVPLHLSEKGRQLGYRPGMFPVAERVARTLIRLPLYTSMTEKEQKAVIKAVKKVFG